MMSEAEQQGTVTALPTARASCGPGGSTWGREGGGSARDAEPPVPDAEAAAREGDLRRLTQVLTSALGALDDDEIPYALIGGVASSGLGRPRTTRDIDIFVRPHDAKRTLDSLSARGFSTEQTDHKWIYKAFREGIQVDIIFNTMGGIYLDQEMLARSAAVSFEGQRVRCVAPEDLIIIKAIVHDEASPRHWFDALGILARTEVDWEYLIHRSRRAQHRVLALLLYAQSLDIHVPDRVIRTMFLRTYEG